MMDIPESPDAEKLPTIETSVFCNKCGCGMPLKQCDSKEFIDDMGYKRFRIRATYLCGKCNDYRVFRISSIVVVDGKFQNVSEDCLTETKESV